MLVPIRTKPSDKPEFMTVINKTYDNQSEIKKASYEFETFKKMFQVYPESSDKTSRFIEVDIEYRINKKNKSFDVNTSSIVLDIPRTCFQAEKHIKTVETDFLRESITLIDKFDGWKSYRNKGRYINNLAFKTIQFSYHLEYFNDKESFKINPDVKPYYMDKTDKYERIINNKYGCDGIINILAVVEIDGELSNIEIVGHEGRISSPFAIDELKSLGKWKPARHNNAKVRSQLDLLIYI